MSEKKQLTLRLPQTTVDYFLQLAEKDNKSLNDIMMEVTEKYIVWHEGEKTLEQITLLREKIKSQSGLHPDSTEDFRQLRDGNE